MRNATGGRCLPGRLAFQLLRLGLLLIFLSGWSLAQSAQLRDVELGIWDRLLQFEAGQSTGDASRVSASLLLNGENDILFGLGADVGNASAPDMGQRWVVSVGLRGAGLVDGGVLDPFVALGLGGKVGMGFTLGTVPVTVVAHGQIFPDALISSADLRRVSEYGLRVDGRLLPGAVAFAGIRRFEALRSQGLPSADFDSGFRVGVRLLFGP